MTTEEYVSVMFPDQDYAALATKFRECGNELAVAASLTVGTWDGHHRLSAALANWFKLVSEERQYRKTVQKNNNRKKNKQ